VAVASRVCTYVQNRSRTTTQFEQGYSDVRAYRAQLAEDHKPASVNTVLAALRRFYAWTADTERLVRNPSQHLVDLPEQLLARPVC